MASLSSTPLLDLAQTISNAALSITRSQLLEHEEIPSFNVQATTNGINGTTKKISVAKASPTKELLDAKAELVQAASDLSTLILGPAVYLKSLAYSVSSLMLQCNFIFPKYQNINQWFSTMTLQR